MQSCKQGRKAAESVLARSQFDRGRGEGRNAVPRYLINQSIALTSAVRPARGGGLPSCSGEGDGAGEQRGAFRNMSAQPALRHDSEVVSEAFLRYKFFESSQVLVVSSLFRIPRGKDTEL